MKTLIKNARLVLLDEVLHGWLLLEDNRILTLGDGAWGGAEQEVEVIDAQGNYLSPGFIEIHTHGAGGADFMDPCPCSMIQAAKTHLTHGTTTLLPTSGAAPIDRMVKYLENFKAAKKAMTLGPNLPGVHLEGPYFSFEQKGAIDERYIRNPDPEEYRMLCDLAEGTIARWSVAPELPGSLEMGDYLSQRGILPTIGHSNAEYAQVLQAYRHGYTHMTHLYSGMSTIVRRSGFRYPGVIESAYILENMTVEVIADGCHLPVEMLKMVWKTKGPGKVCLVCDSMKCAGVEVEESTLMGNREGGKMVLIEDGVAKLPDRSAFAGSIATDDRMVRVMHQKVGAPIYDCVRMMSDTPAKVMGFSSKGRIAPGMDADLVLFDDDIQIKRVFVGGKSCFPESE